MKSAYCWPVYGEQDEICFLYYPSRAAKHVADALGLSPPPGAVLQTNGYSAYAQYARKTGMTHAQCWAHSRPMLIEAQDIEPISAAQALDWIGALYAIETQIRDEGLVGNAKCAHCQEQAKPIVDHFFTWIDQQVDRQGFLPSSPFLGELVYIRERRVGLSVYLDDPEVAIDTNHLERALRLIPINAATGCSHGPNRVPSMSASSRAYWVTCRLLDINPYDYFVDGLQRVGQGPASLGYELTPRIWKQRFAGNPLRSDLHQTTR